jgi:hypothetical protein
MSKNYQVNAEAVLEDLKNEIQISIRLLERNNLSKEDTIERLSNLLSAVEKIKFYLSL